MDDNVSKALNRLARQQMIERLYRDILIDMAVCEIEGWDKMEYIKDLQEVINRFGREQKLQKRDSRYHSGDIR